MFLHKRFAWRTTVPVSEKKTPAGAGVFRLHMGRHGTAGDRERSIAWPVPKKPLGDRSAMPTYCAVTPTWENALTTSAVL
jgi:hypothetical protein